MSQSGSMSDVVFQSTANIRSDGSGDAAWNAATVTSPTRTSTRGYTGYLRDLSVQLDRPGQRLQRLPATHPLRGSPPPLLLPTHGRHRLGVSPLMSVDCSLAPTRVDVMASFFTWPQVRNRLNDMAAAGCGSGSSRGPTPSRGSSAIPLQAPIDVKIADQALRLQGRHPRQVPDDQWRLRGLGGCPSGVDGQPQPHP